MFQKIKSLLKKIRFYGIAKYFKIRKFGKGCYIGYNSIIKPNSLYLGSYVYIGNKCHLSVDKIKIGDYTLLASQVSVVGGDHKFDVVGTPIRQTGRDLRKGVIIGKDCWIGHGVIIFDGVTIGDGSIIGAGSLVTRNIPANSIAIGSPAKVIRTRFSKSDFNRHINEISS